MVRKREREDEVEEKNTGSKVEEEEEVNNNNSDSEGSEAEEEEERRGRSKRRRAEEEEEKEEEEKEVPTDSFRTSDLDIKRPPRPVVPVKSIEGWVIFVRNIHEEAQDEDVHDLFAEYGDITSLHLNLDRRTGFVKGYAAIEYTSREDAQEAIKEMNGKEWRDHVLEVDWAFVEAPPGGRLGSAKHLAYRLKQKGRGRSRYGDYRGYSDRGDRGGYDNRGDYGEYDDHDDYEHREHYDQYEGSSRARRNGDDW